MKLFLGGKLYRKIQKKKLQFFFSNLYVNTVTIPLGFFLFDTQIDTNSILRLFNVSSSYPAIVCDSAGHW